MQPAGYRVAVLPDKVEKTTISGIVYMTDDELTRSSKLQQYGEVLAIGEFAWMDYPAKWCKVGDRVMIAKNAGRWVNEDGDTPYILINDADVLALDKGEK